MHSSVGGPAAGADSDRAPSDPEPAEADRLSHDLGLMLMYLVRSAYLTPEGVRKARELLARYRALFEPSKAEAAASVVRLYAGADAQSHFEPVQLELRPLGDQSEMAELVAGSSILVRRFEANRTNPWHHAPGRYAVFTLQGAVDISVGDGTVRRIGVGDVLLAEDLSGQGHETREVGPEPRISVFVPLG